MLDTQFNKQITQITQPLHCVTLSCNLGELFFLRTHLFFCLLGMWAHWGVRFQVFRSMQSKLSYLLLTLEVSTKPEIGFRPSNSKGWQSFKKAT